MTTNDTPKLKWRACVPIWTYGVESRSEEGVRNFVDCEIRCSIMLWWRVLLKERENKLKQECDAKVYNSNGQS